jgi:hypothetical protein
VEHPYRDGVALVGDAAATTDPTYGQGLSFAMRAARVLRDELRKSSDWEAPGHRYAEQPQRSFHACHMVEGWIRAIFQDPSPEAAALRARAMPLITEDPSRVPDHILSGPDLPLNEHCYAIKCVRGFLANADSNSLPELIKNSGPGQLPTVRRLPGSIQLRIPRCY